MEGKRGSEKRGRRRKRGKEHAEKFIHKEWKESKHLRIKK
jgi:hypothetical protein